MWDRYSLATMILFLYGDDTFRSRRYLEQSIEKFKRERDPQGYNVIRLDGKKIEPSKLFAEIAAAPFLAAKRMVVVENIASGTDKEAMAAIIERLEKQNFPESSVVVFWQGEAVGKTKESKKLYEILTKEKYAQVFEALVGEALVRWLKKEFDDRAVAIASNALQYIATNTGDDVWQAHTLVDQLAAYKRGGTIELIDVTHFLPEKLDNNIFSMIEAIIQGNHKLGMKLLYEQRRLGQEDMQLFGMIIWQFRVLLQIADLLEREPYAQPDAMAKQLEIHPFVIKKNLSVVKRYPYEKLKSVYAKLYEIDWKTKTGQGDQALMLDLFVSSL